jgi:imidazolonepropionase-like amidohydrolase
MTIICRVRVIATAGLVAIATSSGVGAQTVAIVGGTVFPVSGPRIERGTVLMRDGRIVAVGANVAVPAGATTIDASGKWVTPGLVNANASVGLIEVGGVRQTVDDRAAGDHGIAASFAAVDGLNPESEMIPQTRAGGVTSVVMVPNGELVFGQAAAIDLVAGPASGFVVKAPAAMVTQLASPQLANLGARGELVGRLRQLFDDARIYMRHPADYDRGGLHRLSAAPRELAALVPVLSGREPLLVYADGASEIESALRLGHEYGIKVIIYGGAEAWRVAAELADAHVPVLTGALSNAPDDFDKLGQRQENPALLRRAHVEVVLIGNSNTEDAEIFNARNLSQDAGTAVAYGMSWDDALRAVTLAPAEVFGIADRVGSLSAGREANVVVWSGDPFELSTRAEHVFVRGREYTDPTREDLLTQRYRTLPPKY